MLRTVTWEQEPTRYQKHLVCVHEPVLAQTVTTNDVSQFKMFCFKCGYVVADRVGQNIPYGEVEVMTGLLIEDAKRVVPLTIDHLGNERQYQGNPCVVLGCDRTDSELHHWGPVGIFGRVEAGRWPMTALCKDHHAEWHRRVTPELMEGPSEANTPETKDAVAVP